MHICLAIMDMGPGPRGKAQGAVGRDLGDSLGLGPGALGPGPGPTCVMAEHMCIMGNQ